MSLLTHRLGCRRSQFQLRRIRAAADASRELPVVDMGHSIDDFFHDVENKSKHGKELPAWHGELYLEVSNLLVHASVTF